MTAPLPLLLVFDCRNPAMGQRHPLQTVLQSAQFRLLRKAAVSQAVTQSPEALERAHRLEGWRGLMTGGFGFLCAWTPEGPVPEEARVHDLAPQLGQALKRLKSSLQWTPEHLVVDHTLGLALVRGPLTPVDASVPSAAQALGRSEGFWRVQRGLGACLEAQGMAWAPYSPDPVALGSDTPMLDFRKHLDADYCTEWTGLLARQGAMNLANTLPDATPSTASKPRL